MIFCIKLSKRKTVLKECHALICFVNYQNRFLLLYKIYSIYIIYIYNRVINGRELAGWKILKK